MKKTQSDCNQWDSELTDEDIFWINQRGYPVLTEQEQRFFNRFEPWHQQFFLSLAYHHRLKLSLQKAIEKDRSAEALYWRYAEIREFRLRPIMKITHIAELVFPLIEYSHERKLLEDNLINAIEQWGLPAGGLDWKAMYPSVATAENEKEFLEHCTQAGQEARRQRFIFAAVNINDLDQLGATGALHRRVIKYLKVWRCFLGEKLATTNAERVPPKPLRQETQEQYERWNKKVEQYYQPTGKFRFHKRICRKIAIEEGTQHSEKTIANATRDTYQNLKKNS